MQESEFVFAYGSNMDPAQMRERCPESDLSWFIAEARNWRLCFPRSSIRRKGGVGSIVTNESTSVWGVVFAVSPKDLKRLDSFEGVGRSYRRDHIDVLNQRGNSYRVWTYFANPQEDPAKEYTPHGDYIENYVRGAEYFGLPPSYVESLRMLKKTAKKD